MSELAAAHIDLDAPTTLVLTSGHARLVPEALTPGPRAILDTRRLNDIRRINRFLVAANRCLPLGGGFAIRVCTLEQRRHRMRRRLGRFLFPPVCWLDFVFNRMLPKLPVLRRLYFAVSKGRGRAISESEALGRLVFCGFAIVATGATNGCLVIVARKVGPPSRDPDPTYGPLCRLKRVGQHGKTIFVHKLRTMHPYAECLQEYVYRRNHLAVGGKLKDDFRITSWGRLLRRFWLDELPMLFNWLKGDLKLVGVRPLSHHYLSLYPESSRLLRQRFKPGLIPPYYADLPKTLEEIVRSEEAYLRAYELHPLRTDLRYFTRAVYNILFKGVRSR
jgi:lipopolysaccharide/colanic/teichoic acid biosynthesis glycosyltransferase